MDVRRWLRAVGDAYGVAMEDGIHVELSQRALAREMNLTASSVGSRLDTAERHGLLVSRVPMVIAYRDRSVFAASKADSVTLDETRPTGEVGEWVFDAIQAAHGAIAAGHADAGMQLLEVVLDARDMRGVTRETARSPRTEVSQEVANSASNLTSLLTEPARTTPRTRAEVRALVDTLDELARRCGLVRANDWAGVEAALRPYNDAQVQAAVGAVAAAVTAGRAKSPIGYLVDQAKRGSAIFEVTSQPSVPRPTETDEPAASAAEAGSRLQDARKVLRGA